MDLHWLPVHRRVTFKILILTYQAYHGTAPQYLCDLIVLYANTCNLICCKLLHDIFSYKVPDIHTHSKKNVRNYFILFVCCYLHGTILIEVCTLQIKSLSSKF